MKTIEERAEKYAEPFDKAYQHFIAETYTNAATDQLKTDIEKACEWFNTNWRKYIDTDADGMTRFSGWKNDFKKAMEE